MTSLVSEQSSAERAGAFLDLVIAREEDAERRAALWKKRFKSLLWFVVIAPFLTWHWIQCIVSPSYITPSEDDTRTLYLHTRHLFRAEAIDKLETRHTDYGTVEWMKRYPSGEWS